MSVDPVERAPIPSSEASSLARVVNPLAALKHLRQEYRESIKLGREVGEQIQISQLSRAVAKKIGHDIAQHGAAHIFRDTSSEGIRAEVYTLNLMSADLPKLSAWVWKENNPRARTDGRELQLTITDNDTADYSTTFKLFRTPEDPDGFRICFSQNGTREGDRDARNKVITIPNARKILFLEQILLAEPDVTATEEHFGAPYTRDGLRPTLSPDPDPTYVGRWVRDMGMAPPSALVEVMHAAPIK